MADYKVTDAELTSVANKIRTKGSTQAQLEWPTGYISAIDTISGSATLVTKSITQNGTYDPTDDNADGYSQVTVNVSGGGSILVPKIITQNGAYDPANDNADGYSEVTVNVSGGGITSLQYHLGRLEINTGAITESSEYCYSDLIPITSVNGQWFIDLTRNDVNSYYIGVSFYADDGETNAGYIRQYMAYRSYGNTGGGSIKYFRIANKVSNLSFANVAFVTGGIFIVPQTANAYRANFT